MNAEEKRLKKEELERKMKMKENAKMVKLKKGPIEKNLENNRSLKRVNRNLNFDAVPPLKFPKKPEEPSHDDNYPILCVDQVFLFQRNLGISVTCAQNGLMTNIQGTIV